MDGDERRAWIRLLVVLTLVGLLRLGWMHRPGLRTGEVGETRDPAAALDTVNALREEAELRNEPLAPGERLDPNTASEVQLDRLPGVGPATAAAIVAGRAEGRYRSAAELTRVRGIGEATVAKIAPHLSLPTRALPTGRPEPVAGTRPTPIDLNRASPERLTELRGIGPALAERIVALRRERGRFGGVEELLEVRGIGPATLDAIRDRIVVR